MTHGCPKLRKLNIENHEKLIFLEWLEDNYADFIKKARKEWKEE